MAYLQTPVDLFPVETPFTPVFQHDDLDSYVEISETHQFYPDQAHRRMIFLLGFVLGLVSLFILIRPSVSGQDTGASAQADGSGDPVGASSAPLAASILSPVFTPEVQHWSPQIGAWAAQHQLDPNLVATIMQIESCGDPLAVSRAGAQGLFQVMPFHFVAGEDMLDPETNATRGLAYFVERLAQTRGDVGRAFAGYNGGHVAAGSNWDQWAAETQRYFLWSTGIYGEVLAGATESETLQRWLAAGGSSLCQQAAGRLGL